MRILILVLLAVVPILAVAVWPKRLLYVAAWTRYGNRGRLDEIHAPRWAVYYLGHLEQEDKPPEVTILEDWIRTVAFATLTLPLFIGAVIFFVL